MVKKIIACLSVFTFFSSFSMLKLPEVKEIEKPNFMAEEINEKARWKLAEEFSKTQKGDVEAFENLGAQVYRNYIDYKDGVIFKDCNEGYLASFKLGMYVIQQKLVSTYACLYKVALFCIHQGLCSAPADRLSEFFDIDKREAFIESVDSAIEELPQE